MWSIKSGITGKASLAPFLQNLYHDKVLGLPDVAWEQQVPNVFISTSMACIKNGLTCSTRGNIN